MNAKQHPLYIDLKRTVLTTRGLRKLRHILRIADRNLVKNIAPAKGIVIPVALRMQMVYESALDAQAERDEWYDKTFKNAKATLEETYSRFFNDVPMPDFVIDK